VLGLGLPEFFLAARHGAALQLNYLAAHEVAHLVHLDHSPRFWALARELCGDVDRAESWLTTQGSQLHKYGARP
jgi:hypothetical protein